MSREVPLNRIRTVIDSFEYPITKQEVCEQVSDVTLSYADGTEPMADVVSRSNDDVFDDVEDLEEEVFNNLPVEAVGDPGQSEGEG